MNHLALDRRHAIAAFARLGGAMSFSSQQGPEAGVRPIRDEAKSSVPPEFQKSPLPYPPDDDVVRENPNNSQFTIIIIAVTVLGVFNIAAAMFIGLSRVQDKTVLIGVVGGVNVILVTQLLAMAKGAQEQKKTRHDLKGDANTLAIHAHLTQRMIEVHEERAEKRLEDTIKRVFLENAEDLCGKLAKAKAAGKEQPRE
jgi:hypothetical protein